MKRTILYFFASTCLNISILDVPKTDKVKVVIENSVTGEELNLYYKKSELVEKYKDIEKNTLDMASRCPEVKEGKK